jgi:hypothetical protein
MSADVTTQAYDSTLDTLRHSRRVDELLLQLISAIQDRLHRHDESKLYPPEKEIFDEYTPKLKDANYGSDEYRQWLREMKPALDHHYAHNRHHPEYNDNGIDGMTLVDLVEMLADWKAATERIDTGNLGRSLEINQERFGISAQLAAILRNTAVECGWMSG